MQDSNAISFGEFQTTLREQHIRAGCVVHAIKATADLNAGLVSMTRPAGAGVINRVPYLLLHLCVAGEGRVLQKTDTYGFEYDIAPGTLGLAPPGDGYGEWPSGSSVTVGMALPLVERVFAFHGYRCPSPAAFRDRAGSPIFDPVAERILKSMAAESEDVLNQPYIIPGLTTILFRLFEPGQHRSTTDSLPDRATDGGLSLHDLQLITDTIENSYADPLSVDNLCKLLGMTRHHFSRLFKISTGQSPYQYVIEVRLKQAAIQLEEDPSKSITEIALGVGFNDPANFSKAFRSHFGHSPTVWRNVRKIDCWD
ncbi:MAG: AraC family transcriptional regulator [Pseudomonadota bacterium]